MKSYKSGKLPQAVQVIPQSLEWEELLMLTSPETWSPNVSYEATKIFSSKMNEKMV